jgi:hypothetical protein
MRVEHGHIPVDERVYERLLPCAELSHQSCSPRGHAHRQTRTYLIFLRRTTLTSPTNRSHTHDTNVLVRA